MLTLHQSNEYNRHKTLSDLFITPTNATIINTFQPFKTLVADHAANLGILEGLVPNKDLITNGITSNKSTLKHKIADTLALYCCKTRAFALLNNHFDLAEALKTRSDIISRMKDADILPFVQHAVSLINPYISDVAFTPYGITAALLTSLTTDATTFKNSIGIADSTASISNVANVNINATLKKLSDDIDLFDLLINHFQTSNPDFVKAYHITSSLSSIGIHHTGIEGTVTDAANKPLAGATVKIIGTNKVTQTDLNGNYTLIRVKAGEAQLEISQPGYKTSANLHQFTRGHIDTHVVQLQSN